MQLGQIPLKNYLCFNKIYGEFGSLTHYDYGFRIYNPGIGKFLSVDPLTQSYPMLTPYQFASNRPIDGIDLDGLEFIQYLQAKLWWDFTTPQQKVEDVKSIVNGVLKGTENLMHNLSPIRPATEAESAAIEEAGGLIEWYKKTPERISEIPTKLAEIPEKLESVYNSSDLELKTETTVGLFALPFMLSRGKTNSLASNIVRSGFNFKGFAKGKLKIHFEKHGNEFGKITQSQYLTKAKEFASEIGDFQEKIVGNFIVKFDDVTRRVLVGHTKSREIRTFYKADGRSRTPFEDAVKLAEDLSN